MKVTVVRNYEELSEKAASFIASKMISKPNINLAIPMGSTPLGMYQGLVKLHESKGLDFSLATIFTLDEYLGLAPEDPQSYSYFLRSNFIDRINVKPENVHLLSGMISKEKLVSYCKSFEDLIVRNGGLDLAVLGIGGNGHIAFNEPASSPSSRTRMVELTQQTIQDNSRFFPSLDAVPQQAITMGISTIMGSKALMLLASGDSKADILAKALEGPVTEEVPASILQRHKNVIIIADEAAASKLKKRV